MPYGVVLKDERRTSNIERPTSNEKTNTQYRTFNSYFCFFSAVLILVTKIVTVQRFRVTFLLLSLLAGRQVLDVTANGSADVSSMIIHVLKLNGSFFR